jgi:hypothetical protein
MPRTIKTFHQLYSSVSKKLGISSMNEYNSMIIDLSSLTPEQAINQLKECDRQLHVAHMIYYFNSEKFTSEALDNFFAKAKEIFSTSNKTCFLTNCISKDDLFSSPILIKVFRAREEFDLSLIDPSNTSYSHYQVMFTNNFLPANPTTTKTTTKVQEKICDIVLDRASEESEAPIYVRTFKRDFHQIDEALVFDTNKFVGEIHSEVTGLIDSFNTIYDASIELV